MGDCPWDERYIYQSQKGAKLCSVCVPVLDSCQRCPCGKPLQVCSCTVAGCCQPWPALQTFPGGPCIPCANRPRTIDGLVCSRCLALAGIFRKPAILIPRHLQLVDKLPANSCHQAGATGLSSTAWAAAGLGTSPDPALRDPPNAGCVRFDRPEDVSRRT